jgi:hypothetical protein
MLSQSCASPRDKTIVLRSRSSWRFVHRAVFEVLLPRPGWGVEEEEEDDDEGFLEAPALAGILGVFGGTWRWKW